MRDADISQPPPNNLTESEMGGLSLAHPQTGHSRLQTKASRIETRNELNDLEAATTQYMSPLNWQFEAPIRSKKFVNAAAPPAPILTSAAVPPAPSTTSI